MSIEAEKVACSSADDLRAKALLAERFNAEPDTIHEALAILARRTEYVSNRAHRLLSAVDTDGTVAPMPQELAELFTQEEALGRMPLDQAFRHLAKIEPHLMDLDRCVDNEQRTKPADRAGLSASITDALVDLVGVGARVDDELLRTNLAASVVRQYLEIRSGTAALGGIGTPYFDAPVKIGVRSSGVSALNIGKRV